MDDLEEILKEIREWKRDLSAERILEPEKGHTESVGCIARGGGAAIDRERIYEDEWVVDKPAVTEPNYEMRREARNHLLTTHDSHRYYSARYKAGEALEVNDLDRKSDSWIDTLENNPTQQIKNDLSWFYILINGKERKMRVGRMAGKTEADILGDCFDSGLSEEEARLVYEQASRKYHKEWAGRKLGKTERQIFYHVSPIKALAHDVTVGTGIAAGAAYLIYNCFTG